MGENMIAIPVARRDGGVLKNVNLFTKAKLIALVNDKDEIVEVMENSHTSGKTLAQDLIAMGVKTLLTNHMGQTPYQLLTAAGVAILFRPGSTETGELLQLLRSNALEPMTADMVHSSKHQHHAGDNHSCDCGS